MKKARHVDYYPDEYIAGASVLPYEQQGVYWMICSLVISHGGPIERDEKWFGGLGKMGTAKVRNIINDLIRKGKLTEKDGKISQKRAENAVKTAEKRIEISQENGKKGGRPSTKTKDLDKPEGFPSHKPNHQPPTTNLKESVPNGTDSQIDDSAFTDLWQSWQPYKTPKGPKRDAEAEWDKHVRKAGIDPGMVTMQAVAYCEECRRTDTNTQNVFRWIRKHRWTDERLSIENSSSKTETGGKAIVAAFGNALRDRS